MMMMMSWLAIISGGLLLLISAAATNNISVVEFAAKVVCNERVINIVPLSEANLNTCATNVQNDEDCGRFFDFGAEKCACVLRGANCSLVSSADTQNRKVFMLADPKPQVPFLQFSAVDKQCANRQAAGTVPLVPGSIAQCAANVFKEPQCGDYFDYHANGDCYCAPVGSECDATDALHTSTFSIPDCGIFTGWTSWSLPTSSSCNGTHRVLTKYRDSVYSNSLAPVCIEQEQQTEAVACSLPLHVDASAGASLHLASPTAAVVFGQQHSSPVAIALVVDDDLESLSIDAVGVHVAGSFEAESLVVGGIDLVTTLQLLSDQLRQLEAKALQLGAALNNGTNVT